ncbi:hypothetical protein ACJ41O_001703 [Fusarium nematophilum]
MGPPRSLLLTGATGFVGGTILSRLLASSHADVHELSITALVRKQSQADILAEQGIQTEVLAGGLDDTEGLLELAQQYDIVLNGATGFHAPSSKAFIKGLALRKQERAAEVFYVHLSGTSNLAVGDATGRGGELRHFSDKYQGIFEYEVAREADDPYEQRTADVAVVEAGEEFGVRTYIIMPPLIWGTGAGYFKKVSQQIPRLVRNAVQHRRLEYVAPGTSSLGHVHVTDLAALFEVVLARSIEDSSLPAGRNGYFFANTGRHAWKEVAEKLAVVGHDRGILDSPVAVPLDLGSAAARFFDSDAVKTERTHASTSSTIAERGREIGWKPEKTEEDWWAGVGEALDTA